MISWHKAGCLELAAEQGDRGAAREQVSGMGWERRVEPVGREGVSVDGEGSVGCVCSGGQVARGVPVPARGALSTSDSYLPCV